MRAITPNKPFLIPRTGAPRNGCGATAGNDGQDRWVRDMFTYAAADPNVVGLLYFNFDKSGAGETDWRVVDRYRRHPRVDRRHDPAYHRLPVAPHLMAQPGPLTVGPPTGFLRVTTSPAVGSQILVDGAPYDSCGLNWLTLPAGSYPVSFTDVEGFTTPAPQTVTVPDGGTGTHVGSFEQRGSVRVSTSPAVPATISVDGIPRNDWGMWTDLTPGNH